MFVDTTINAKMSVLDAASGGPLYLYMPYKAKIADVQGIVQGATTSSSFSVTVSAPSTSSVSSIGTLAFSNSASSVAAKSVGTYTKDTSSGSAILSAGDILQLVVGSAGTGSFDIHFTVELNPYTN